MKFGIVRNNVMMTSRQFPMSFVVAMTPILKTRWRILPFLLLVMGASAALLSSAAQSTHDRPNHTETCGPGRSTAG